MAPQALAGMRVLDLSLVWAGPQATQILGELGAEIIKIESIQHPDSLRRGYYPNGDPGEHSYNRGGYFHMHNHNKLDITLDLTRPEGAAIFKELVKTADIVIENYTPRVLKNFGLDYPVLKEIKPDIILISMPGFGLTGPHRDYFAFGHVVEALSGLTSLTGYGDGSEPLRCPFAYGDPISGLYAALAVMAAYRYRRRTGRGQHIDLSQREGVTRFIGEFLMEYAMNRRVPQPLGNRDNFMAPHGCYRCTGKDRWITLAVSRDAEWRQLCQVMGQPALANDERFATAVERWHHQDELDKIIEAWTSQQEHRELMHRLQQAGVAAGAVYDIAEVYADPQLQARGFFETLDYPEAGRQPHFTACLRLSKTPGRIRTPAPTLGQHNEPVLRELVGLTPQEIAHLQELKIIGTEPVEWVP